MKNSRKFKNLFFSSRLLLTASALALVLTTPEYAYSQSGGGGGGSGGGGGAGVTTFNGRSGVVAPALNDYSFSQIGGTATHSQLAATAATPGTYSCANITIQADGTITAAASGTCGGAIITSVFGRTGAIVAATNDYSFSQISGTITPAAQLPASGATAGSYTCPNVTITATGLVTAAAGGACGVTSVFGRTGTVVAAANDYAFNQISGTIVPSTQFPNSGVTSGSYTCPAFTVTPQGLLTAASNGSCGGFSITDGTNTVTGTTSLSVTGGTVGGTSPNATLSISGGGGGSGALVKIAKRTASNSTALVFGQGQTEGSLAALAYNRFMLDCNQLAYGTNNPSAYVQFGESTGPTIKVSNYAWGLEYRGDGVAQLNGIVFSSSTPSSNVGLIVGSGTGPTTVTNNFIAWFSLGTAEIQRMMQLLGKFADTSGNPYHQDIDGYYSGDQNPITALQVVLYDAPNGTQQTGAAALVSGQCTLYGVTP